MKKSIVLAVILSLSHTIGAFAGPEEPSKQVIAPPAPPPPEYFRPNEFDIGAFASWAEGTGSGSHESGGKLHGWGGGMDFTYWFPWKYAGVRFQGAGYDVSSNNGQQTREVTLVPGFTPTRTVTTGNNSVAAGVINSDFLLRLPLDDFWPGVHLAPYAFGGFGGIFAGGGGQGRSFSETFTVTNSAGVTKDVTFHGRVKNALNQDFANSRVLGRIGGGLEYRFTPHIGLFTEASYVFPEGGHDFVQFNFIGLRYAF